MPIIIDLKSYDPSQSPEAQAGLLHNREYVPASQNDTTAALLDPGLVALEAQRRTQEIADTFDTRLGTSYVQGIPQELTSETIYDAGTLSGPLDLTALSCPWNGRVLTCELWFTLPEDTTYPVTFPADWIWVDRSFNNLRPGDSYRLVVRREPVYTVINLAYVLSPYLQ